MHKFSIYFLPLLLLLTACHKKETIRTIPDDVIPVKTMALEQKSSQALYTISGQFTTEDESILSFKNGGILRSIYVNEGDAVKKGQLLAMIDKTEINTLTSQAEIALAKAERDYVRASNLYKDSVATLEQMQNAASALEIARQQAANAQFNQSTTSLYATQSGFVLKKFAQPGQIIGPGTPIIMINGASNADWILKAGVSDRQWAAIKIGDAATITTDAFPDKTIEGVVAAKSEGVDPQTGTFSVSVKLKGRGQKGIATGLFGKAVIKSSTKQNAWYIPYGALMDSDRNQGYVFVTKDHQTAQKVAVTIDHIEHKQVVITSGLEDFPYLILEGNAYLTDGSKIKTEQ